MPTFETYEQARERREREKIREERVISSLSIEKDIISEISNRSSTVKSIGQEKLNELIISKSIAFSSQALSGLYLIADQLGIKNITTSTPSFPDLCPETKILLETLKIRDTIVKELNILSKYLIVTQKSLSILTDLLNGQINIVKALSLIRTTTSIGAKAIVALPGAVVSALSDVESIRLSLTFDIQGNPKLEKVKQVVLQGNQYLTQASIILNKVLTVIEFIDLVLKKCQKNQLEKISDDVKSITIINSVLKPESSELYQGFILSTETKEYSSTVTQIRATAKNSQGIVLLSTPYSFTSKPELLISELKFRINLENLKPF